ncbi:YebO family protein [Serratia sp. UGAL515B_01]|uniref:YebO family protein n=1 Tax=Serratia sp. UGAL515B_01 TaxID=2986763 RepID=UPI002955B0B1|nr:YebO family protein [Serratia sp. UGAL515B_01]WON78306.1 YebO family protein [Serratia sp. UGAL515B_01]
MYNLAYGVSGLIAIIAAVLAAVFCLWGWFLVNRASVRANEQIQLLKEISEQQRQQTALLKTLVQKAQGDKAAPDDDDDLNSAFSYKGFIPER